MTEEQFLKLREKQSFSVPEGYFDHLADRVMAQIPDAAPAKTRKRFILRRPVWAAACVAAIIGGVALFFFGHTADGVSDKPTASVAASDVMSADDLQRVADDMMIDDDELYAYMADF